MVPPSPPAILVIDDEPDILEALVDVLEGEGYHAAGARGGEEALAMLRADPSMPRLILLDLMMPGMDGATFRNEQLKDPALAAIPVVLLTADSYGARHARELSVDAFLPKPLGLNDLLEVVARYCGPTH